MTSNNEIKMYEFKCADGTVIIPLSNKQLAKKVYFDCMPQEKMTVTRVYKLFFENTIELDKETNDSIFREIFMKDDISKLLQMIEANSCMITYSWTYDKLAPLTDAIHYGALECTKYYISVMKIRPQFTKRELYEYNSRAGSQNEISAPIFKCCDGNIENDKHHEIIKYIVGETTYGTSLGKKNRSFARDAIYNAILGNHLGCVKLILSLIPQKFGYNRLVLAAESGIFFKEPKFFIENAHPRNKYTESEYNIDPTTGKISYDVALEMLDKCSNADDGGILYLLSCVKKISTATVWNLIRLAKVKILDELMKSKNEKYIDCIKTTVNGLYRDCIGYRRNMFGKEISVEDRLEMLKYLFVTLPKPLNIKPEKYYGMFFYLLCSSGMPHSDDVIINFKCLPTNTFECLIGMIDIITPRYCDINYKTTLDFVYKYSKLLIANGNTIPTEEEIYKKYKFEYSDIASACIAMIKKAEEH